MGRIQQPHRSQWDLPKMGRSAKITAFMGFPGGSDGRESACSAGDPGSVPGLGRSPGEGNGYPLQYSCLENPMDRGAWRAAVHGVAVTQIRLSEDFHVTLSPAIILRAGRAVLLWVLWVGCEQDRK